MLPQSNSNVKDWPNGLADVEARSSRNSMALNEYLGDSASTKMSGEPFGVYRFGGNSATKEVIDSGPTPL